MTDYLRVKQTDTGHELTVSQTLYDFSPEGYTVLKDEPATDSGNTPLPPVYNTSGSSESEKKKAPSGQKKENV